MGFLVPCPNCGPRSYHEFSFGGEVAEPRDPWLRDNLAGPQAERWFHAGGCRRWLTLVRDTRTNTFVTQP